MNKMYDLPVKAIPEAGEDFEERIWQFQDILQEEVKEAEDICAFTDDLDRLVALADWLGDIVVYCFGEAARHGIPIEAVLEIIMDSNASKLGDDGKPIKDARGKFLKGPNYWKPEPKIKELLSQIMGA
jgi:predicted HAD superfamily Cof-like phosphohydrolase